MVGTDRAEKIRDRDEDSRHPDGEGLCEYCGGIAAQNVSVLTAPFFFFPP